MTILRTALLCALLSISCRREGQPTCVPAGAVLACVDGEPIRTEGVAPLVRTPPIAIDAPRIDPATRALDEAIRARLFAKEARRRGLSGSSEAELAQALIASEMPSPLAARDAITDAEARAYYDAHPLEFLKVEAIEARGIALPTLDAATRIAAEARGVDDAKFAALAKQHSTNASRELGGELGKIDEHSSFDDALVRAALSLRLAGQTAGPVVDHKGQWWIVRAVSVDAAPRPFDPIAVKNGMAKLRRDERIAALEKELRARATIAINHSGVAALPSPST